MHAFANLRTDGLEWWAKLEWFYGKDFFFTLDSRCAAVMKNISNTFYNRIGLLLPGVYAKRIGGVYFIYGCAAPTHSYPVIGVFRRHITMCTKNMPTHRSTRLATLFSQICTSYKSHIAGSIYMYERCRVHVCVVCVSTLWLLVLGGMPKTCIFFVSSIKQTPSWLIVNWWKKFDKWHSFSVLYVLGVNFFPVDVLMFAWPWRHHIHVARYEIIYNRNNNREAVVAFMRPSSLHRLLSKNEYFRCSHVGWMQINQVINFFLPRKKRKHIIGEWFGSNNSFAFALLLLLIPAFQYSTFLIAFRLNFLTGCLLKTCEIWFMPQEMWRKKNTKKSNIKIRCYWRWCSSPLAAVIIKKTKIPMLCKSFQAVWN